jgi:hypothetical protein
MVARHCVRVIVSSALCGEPRYEVASVEDQSGMSGRAYSRYTQ